jgi:AraC-like DNA-binding protein
VARPFFDVKLLTEQKDFLGEATFYKRDGLLATKVAFSDQRHERTPKRLRQVDSEIVLIETYISGSSRGILGDQATFSKNGSVQLMDWSRPYAGIVSGGARGIGLQIPHAKLGFDPSKHVQYRALPPNSPRGTLLSTSLRLLVDEMSKGATNEVDGLTASTLGIVRTCLLDENTWDVDPQGDIGRRKIVEGYIRQNLSPQPPNVRGICRDLGMSRATLYRCFGQGGVERFIRTQLLERCFDDLIGAPATRGSVRQVAERWGFYDAGNFRKSFRAHFGLSPSDCLGETGALTQVRH